MGALDESLVTVKASVGSFSRMKAHMPFQVIALAKAPRAERALKRTLARMNTTMSVEIPPAWKTLWTDGTFVQAIQRVNFTLFDLIWLPESCLLILG